MANKRFYEAAVAEVEAGELDSALWIKVNAEFPDAERAGKQAAYIRLRADELSKKHVTDNLAKYTPKSKAQWLLALIGTFVAAFVITTLSNIMLDSKDSELIVLFFSWGALLVILGVLSQVAKNNQ